jgi:hypothetical protein
MCAACPLTCLSVCLPAISICCTLLQRYNFDRQALLLTLVQLTGQLAQHAAFPQVGGAPANPQHLT